MATPTARKKPNHPSQRVKRLLPRSKVRKEDQWDLASLFRSDQAWEQAFKKWEAGIDGYEQFRGTLSRSASQLAECLAFDSQVDRAGERLGTYAHLKTTEDSTNSHYQRMMGRYLSVASRVEQAASYIRPEILAIPTAKLERLVAEKVMEPWRLAVDRIVRFRPHTLSKGEERLLAMQLEMAQATSHTFRQLHDSDMRFGLVRDEQGNAVELSHGNFSKFLESTRRSVRRTAYERYYGHFAQHQHSLAATLAGSIHKDVYYAKARGYSSALAAALFPDQVPDAVYNNLIVTVTEHLPALHKYYALRSQRLRLTTFRLYDQYVSLFPQAKMRHTWDQAVRVVLEALAPLGAGYCQTLRKGFHGRWCDRYPNVGKSSGAFSAGTYDGDPYILMNFQPDVLNDVFTLAHEAGHSMHSHYSAGHQPYQYYNYTIFVAEVASTFNEQLLARHLLAKAWTAVERTRLISREIDNIRGTVLRQTMFAEFEKQTHALCEAGEPLTIDAFKDIYRQLLVRYLGPQFELDDHALLECLRIPHFYHAFYVYKYATGMSAAIALAERVLSGSESELKGYLGFLKSGCSKYPLELLRDAGVDMTRPEPVQAALVKFTRLVDELERLLRQL